MKVFVTGGCAFLGSHEYYVLIRTFGAQEARDYNGVYL